MAVPSVSDRVEKNLIALFRRKSPVVAFMGVEFRTSAVAVSSKRNEISKRGILLLVTDND